MRSLVGKPALWVLLVGTIFTIPLVRAMTAKAPPPLPNLGTIAYFRFTDQNGQPFGSDELRGRIWVANFIYTRCPTVCPLLTEQMSKIQYRARNLGDAFHLVSFTVDPDYDTPAKLTEFASHYKASPRRWSFLTGPYDQLKRTVVENMKVTMDGRGSPINITHGTHVVLVDPQMRIRGYYDTSDPADVDRLMHDIGMLVAPGA